MGVSRSQLSPWSIYSSASRASPTPTTPTSGHLSQAVKSGCRRISTRSIGIQHIGKRETRRVARHGFVVGEAQWWRVCVGSTESDDSEGRMRAVSLPCFNITPLQFFVFAQIFIYFVFPFALYPNGRNLLPRRAKQPRFKKLVP